MELGGGGTACYPPVLQCFEHTCPVTSWERRQDDAGWLQLGWPWQLLTSESSRREVQKGLGQELGQRWSQRSRSALSPDQETLLYKHGGVPEP